MAKRVKQYRYYSEGDTVLGKTNQPLTITGDDGSSIPVSYVHYISGRVFGNAFPVLQLGIQAIPGTKFYLNNAVDPIIIGLTGIYELDLEGQTEITAIQIDASSMANIRDNYNASLIIDVIYEDGEVED
jgi:hypothetical protein